MTFIGWAIGILVALAFLAVATAVLILFAVVTVNKGGMR